MPHKHISLGGTNASLRKRAPTPPRTASVSHATFIRSRAAEAAFPCARDASFPPNGAFMSRGNIAAASNLSTMLVRVPRAASVVTYRHGDFDALLLRSFINFHHSPLRYCRPSRSLPSVLHERERIPRATSSETFLPCVWFRRTMFLFCFFFLFSTLGGRTSWKLKPGHF